MNRRHHRSPQNDRNTDRRHRRVSAGDPRQQPIPLTAEGFPAATADVPKPSPAVLVSDES